MTSVRIWRTLAGIAVVGGLAVIAAILVLALSGRGKECNVESGDCWGVNWQTVTVEEMTGVDIHARDKNGGTPLDAAKRTNKNPAVEAASQPQ